MKNYWIRLRDSIWPSVNFDHYVWENRSTLDLWKYCIWNVFVDDPFWSRRKKRIDWIAGQYKNMRIRHEESMDYFYHEIARLEERILSIEHESGKTPDSKNP